MKNTPLPPVNRYAFEKEFHDFIQEVRGFNARFAEQLGLRDDSHVSRMHSPFVEEVPSWLYKAAAKIDAACRADLSVGRKALAMLSAVVRRHEAEPAAVSTNTLESAYHNFRAVLAAREDGQATQEAVEEARGRLAEAAGRCGRPERMATVQFS
jgi:hypothetical protein